MNFTDKEIQLVRELGWNMNRQEFRNFYIAYSILKGKDNLAIQTAIKHIPAIRHISKEHCFRKITDIRECLENGVGINSDLEVTRKAILMWILDAPSIADDAETGNPLTGDCKPATKIL